MYVLPAGVVLGDDRVAEMREQRRQQEAQAQQQQQMMAEGQAVADAAPKVAGAMQAMSETQMPEGGNALQGLGDMMNSGMGLM